MGKKPISVRLDERIHTALVECVADSGSSVTAVVEAALTAYLGMEDGSNTLADRVAALEEWRDGLGKLQRVA